MSGYSNYPDNIRDFDNDPRSPFYEDPDEGLEELVEAELDELLTTPADKLDANDRDLLIEAVDATLEGEDAVDDFHNWLNAGDIYSINDYKRLLELAQTEEVHAYLYPMFEKKIKDRNEDY